jgi:hypothetical protein
MSDEASYIKYPSFKSTVKERDKHDTYMKVWSAMYAYQERLVD